MGGLHKIDEWLREKKLTYDVDFSEESGMKRLRKVARVCEKYGVRVQNSVFEMLVDPAQLVEIKQSIWKIIDKK